MIMRRYRGLPTQQRTVSEDSEGWRPRTHFSDSDETSFNLKTASGVLSYKSNDNNSYTDFLRVSITMLLAFNANEIDPEFKKLMNRALSAYEHGDSLISEYSEDDEESDFVAAAFANAQSEAAKMDEATKFASNLPEADEYRLQILSVESEDTSNIEGILSKRTDFPPPLVHDIVVESKPFVLPAEKAKEVYVQLRMLDVMVNIKVKTEESTTSTVKKSAAKKVASKKGSATRKSTKAKNSDLTGLEKLPRTEGIIAT
jgi:hypothetical protein